MLAGGVLSLVLAFLLLPTAIRLGTGASLTAFILVLILGMALCLLAVKLTRTMGFQSFLRMGGEVKDMRLYTVVLTTHTCAKLDLLTSLLSLIYMIAIWGHAIPSSGATSAMVFLSLACAGLAYAATFIHPGGNISILLPISLLIGFGVTFALLISGGSAASLADAANAPMLRTPYCTFYAGITTTGARLVASILSLFVFTQRKRLQAPKKELPQELQNLNPKQKKALNKIAQGEVLDVKMSGALEGANRDDQARRRRTAMAAMEAAMARRSVGSLRSTSS